MFQLCSKGSHLWFIISYVQIVLWHMRSNYWLFLWKYIEFVFWLLNYWFFCYFTQPLYSMNCIPFHPPLLQYIYTSTSNSLASGLPTRDYEVASSNKDVLWSFFSQGHELTCFCLGQQGNTNDGFCWLLWQTTTKAKNVFNIKIIWCKTNLKKMFLTMDIWNTITKN